MAEGDAAASLVGSLQGMFGGMLWLILIIVVVLILFIIFGIIAFFVWRKRRWNLNVLFRLTRSDGRYIGMEVGKGAYLRSGKVMLKRKGVKKYYMAPFDLKQYLFGSNSLEVQQVGVADFIPVHPRSYEVITSKNGTRFAVVDLVGDIEKSRSWKNYNERELKAAFSIQSLLSLYGQYIAIGVMMLLVFIGFSILWARIPSICSGAA